MLSAVSEIVYALDQAPEDPAVSGGKGAGLARLVRLGAQVPAGFVVSTAAFERFVVESGVKLGRDDEDEENALVRLRSADWPADVRSEIEFSYGSLQSGGATQPAAVRSSGSAEDGREASFAGQHATVLNARSLDAVLDAVLVCWASLYRAEARAYRRSQGISDQEPTMAVVVQALVHAEASGVAFTVDPVSGADDVVLIDAAFGLGESVVSGAVTPDHFAVEKSVWRVRERRIATKRLRVVPDERGGVRSEALEGSAARQPSLTEQQAIELAKLVVEIERQADAPQDVEWALAGGEIYLLQARPVTAAAGRQAVGWVSEFDTETDAATIWTAANVQEVLPGQLSPFSCAFNQTMIERFGNQPVERIGIRLETPDPFFAFFYGRAFLNVTMMQEVVEQTPFGSREAMLDQYFGHGRDGGETAHDVDLTLKPSPLPKKLWRYASVTPRVLWYLLRMAAEVRRAEETVTALEREDADRPLELQTEEELIATFEDGLVRGAEVSVTHISGGGITSSSFETLRRCTEGWLGDDNGALQATLCTGLSGLESAAPAFELWHLSRIVLASNELRTAFEPRDGAEIERRLDALPDDVTATFRSRRQAFLQEHGHRGLQEAEMAAKTWEEDPPTVFAMIRNYLHADPASSPQRLEERQRHAREAATEDCQRRLSWWRRPIFRYALRQAQGSVASREHTKSLLVRVSNRGRRITRALARRMVERGLLAELWDFYQLRWEEVIDLVRSNLSRAGAYERIARRRAEGERNSHVHLPETFRGRPALVADDDHPLPEGDILRGIAVSPGRVTGIARVIHDPRAGAVIEPGEILVAPVTDAGWTPLFVAAAAVVVDIGGTLSHGSTVAREFGLPAVVNVKHGTRMIRDGQRITVDGTAGVVVLTGEE